jgi:Na+-transporting methylmalonyl-CoA/oxaloacetate decarboxylase gamma subunit
MKEFTIFKGVDNEIEFKGLRGKYFYFGAIGGVGSIFSCLILVIIGIPSVIVFLLLILLLITSISAAFHFSQKYGRWGMEKQPIQKRKPHFIHQGKPFHKIIPALTVLKHPQKNERK